MIMMAINIKVAIISLSEPSSNSLPYVSSYSPMNINKITHDIASIIDIREIAVIRKEVSLTSILHISTPVKITKVSPLHITG